MCRIQVKGPTRGYSYYVCSAHRRNSRVCGTHSIREEELLSQVELFDTQAIYDADLRVSDDGRVVVV